MQYYDEYPEYVPVGERRARAEKKLKQLQKTKPHIKPVIIAGSTLATTWWGKSWNSNLERYADYSNRIGRGRSYVRHRAVLDLRLTRGKITALVQGSRTQPYDVVITVDTLNAGNWETLRQACAGCFDSLSELLAGTFPQALKEMFFEKGAGLFPSPREIHFDCSCPDWATMCKHVAAALYGVGARLDEDPSFFFTLRGINVDDLITQTVADTAQTLLRKAQRPSDNILEDVDLGAVFGIQLDNLEAPLPVLPPVKPPASTTPKNVTKAPKTSSRPERPQVGKQMATPRRSTRRKTTSAVLPAGTMLDALLKAVGKARKGKSIAQLQDRLGWTKTQLRNAISRAGAKGLVELVTPGVYRQKV